MLVIAIGTGGKGGCGAVEKSECRAIDISANIKGNSGRLRRRDQNA